MSASWLDVVPSAILLVGAVEDLRTRKVRNKTVLALAGAALLSQFAFQSWVGVSAGLLGFAAALVGCLPLVMGRVIGAGDMKLLAAFGLSTQWTAVVSVLLWALIWGAILGVIQAVLSGKLKELIFSTVAVARRRKEALQHVQTMPFTLPLMFGWFTYLAMAHMPAGVWI